MTPPTGRGRPTAASRTPATALLPFFPRPAAGPFPHRPAARGNTYTGAGPPPRTRPDSVNTPSNQAW